MDVKTLCANIYTMVNLAWSCTNETLRSFYAVQEILSNIDGSSRISDEDKMKLQLIDDIADDFYRAHRILDTLDWNLSILAPKTMKDVDYKSLWEEFKAILKEDISGDEYAGTLLSDLLYGMERMEKEARE